MIKNREAREVEINQLLKENLKELNENIDVLEKNKGGMIKFGERIQFFHVQSQKFLNFDPLKSSKLDSDKNLAVYLGERFSDYSVFNLAPVFKYQTSNDGYVMNGDKVYIVSSIDKDGINIKPYLNASIEKKNIPKLNSLKSSEKIGGNQETEVIEYGELNATNQKERCTSFKMTLFSSSISGSEDERFLLVNDVIWINFTEKNLSFLSVGYKSLKDQKQGGRFKAGSTVDKYSKFVGNSNGLFRIESFKNDGRGGIISWGKEYRLKHIS